MKSHLCFTTSLALSLMCASQVYSQQDQPAQKPVLLGEFIAKPVVSLYLDSKTPNNKIILRVIRGTAPNSQAMLRVFDPEETLVARKYYPSDTKSGDEAIDVVLEKPGVYQIRLSSGNQLCRLRVESSVPLDYGVSFQNGEYTPWRAQPEEMYLLWPKGLEAPLWTSSTVTLEPLAGSSARVVPAEMKPQTTIVNGEGQIFRVPLPRAGWSMRASTEFPFILCTTPETAQRIDGSLVRLPDGIIVSHLFQKNISEILPALLQQFGSAKELSELPLDPAVLNEKPLVSAWLFREAIGPVRKFIQKQIDDPSSPWSGAIAGWVSSRDGKHLSPEVVRKLRWYPAENMRSPEREIGVNLTTGLSYPSGHSLARAYALKLAGNPYTSRPEILARATAAGLRDLSNLSEAEVWSGTGAEWDPYPGFSAFSFGGLTQSFAMLAPYLNDETRRVWTNGLQRFIDRMASDPMVSTMNQSAHTLLGIREFADATGTSEDDLIAGDVEVRFLANQAPAGYFPEAEGPDATYSGLGHNYIAHHAMQTKNPDVIDALSRSYDFWNSTVAPANGSEVENLLGFSSLSHRTADGFHFEQYGGARGIADIIPQVAVWSSEGRDSIYGVTGAETASNIEKWIKDGATPTAPFPSLGRIWYSGMRAQSALFPALAKPGAGKVLGNEMFTIKTSQYYLASYFGLRHAGNILQEDRLAPLRQFVPNPKDFPYEVGIYGLQKIKRNLPFNNGGIGLLWNPKVGIISLSTNWSPFARNGLVAIHDGNAMVDWEDFPSIRSETSQESVTTRGKIKNSSLAFVRRMHLNENSIRMDLEVNSEGPSETIKLLEIIPLLEGKVRKVQPTVVIDPDNKTIKISYGIQGEVLIRHEGFSGVQIHNAVFRNKLFDLGYLALEFPVVVEGEPAVAASYTISFEGSAESDLHKEPASAPPPNSGNQPQKADGIWERLKNLFKW